MQTYLERNIKDLIAEYPALADILTNAGIGCITCALGTCRVKDIIEIHNLDAETTQKLLTAMGKTIYSSAPFVIPVIERTPQTPRNTFSPPMRILVREHTVILRVIALVPKILTAFENNFDATLPHLEGALGFIRDYADHLHHAKEEDILFGYFDQTLDIIASMHADHTAGRAHIAAVRKAIPGRDCTTIRTHLEAYSELLTGHIGREDTILYPWMDRRLTDREIGELYGKCLTVDNEQKSTIGEYESIVTEWENIYAV